LSILTIPSALADGGGGVECPEILGAYTFINGTADYQTKTLGEDEFGILYCEFESDEENTVPIGSIEAMFHISGELSANLREEYGCGEKLGEELSPQYVSSTTHFAVVTFSTSGLQNTAENIITQIEQQNLATVCATDSTDNSNIQEIDEDLEKIIKRIDEPVKWTKDENETITEIKDIEDGIELGFQVVLPDWIKDNAGWWAADQISDEDYSLGIEYLITQGIIVLPPTEVGSETSDEIPGWVKFNAGWWAEGQITDSEFIDGLQYLISKGIISVIPN